MANSKQTPAARRPADNSTGHFGQPLAPVEGRDRAGGRVSLPAWITEELVAYTQETWSAKRGRPVTPDEAIEMLINVKRLAETLLKIADEEKGMGRT